MIAGHIGDQITAFHAAVVFFTKPDELVFQRGFLGGFN
jgi:hypothetical protein